MEMEIHDPALETKAITSADAKTTYDEMMRVFEDLKSANEDHLGKISRRSDVLLEEKIARLDEEMNRKFDEMSLKAHRPALGREKEGVTSHSQREHKSAFVSYMRSGETAGLRQLELKALSVGSNSDGGYVVPVEIEQAIGSRLKVISPIRSIAGVRTISGNVYKKPFMISGPAVG